MLGFKLFFPALLIAQVFATAVPAPEPMLPLAPGGSVNVNGPVTCGKKPYQQAQIRGALKKGVRLMNEKKQVKNYPHKFNNREKFDFDVQGPYEEFPILRNGQLYDGGEPGPDRVIFNEKGEYVDLITHQGASGNEFVECKVTPDVDDILSEIFEKLNQSILERMAEIVKAFSDSQAEIKESINSLTSEENNIGSEIADTLEVVA